MNDLTEQWKKGELPSGYYYVKNEFGNIFPSDYSEDYDCIGDTVIKDFFTEVSEIKEVLEPVPSYEKYISLVNWKEDLTELCTVKERIIEKYENIDTWWKAECAELKEENAQLKELLKECRSPINYALCLNLSEEEKIEFKNLLAKIKQALGEDK